MMKEGFMRAWIAWDYLGPKLFWTKPEWMPAPIRRFIPRQGETPRILSMSELNGFGGCEYNTCQQIELTATPVGAAEGGGS